MGWAIALSLVIVLAATLAFAVYSPVLALRTIDIVGTKSVSAAAVRSSIDGQLGTPLALLDYGKLRNELNSFPMIRSFTTEVVPPSTLVITLVERVPVGAVTSSSGFSVVDPAGVVLGTAATRQSGLPLIDSGQQGSDSVGFRSIVDVLLALPDSIRSKVDIAQASSKDDVLLILRGTGQRVVWGSADRSALKSRVLTELMAAHKGSDTVEFDVSAPLSPVVRRG